MADFTSIANKLRSISSVGNAVNTFRNLILVTPENKGYQPTQQIISGAAFPSNDKAFLFHYEGEQKYNLTADITDHFIESNTAIQDNIAIKPEKFTTQGFIGELNDVVPDELKVLQTIANKLTIINAYTPALSATALIAFNEAETIYRTAYATVTAAKQAFDSLVFGSTPQNKQQTAFQMFSDYFNKRTLFTIQTPWRVKENMVIESLTAIQDGETDTISTFEITFKSMSFATTRNFQDALFQLGQARFNAQSNSEPKNLGTSSGQETTNNVSSMWSNTGGINS